MALNALFQTLYKDTIAGGGWDYDPRERARQQQQAQQDQQERDRTMNQMSVDNNRANNQLRIMQQANQISPLRSQMQKQNSMVDLMPDEEDILGLASGGPLRPNRMHLVGEEGPELIVPSQQQGGFDVVPAKQTKQIMAKRPKGVQKHASGTLDDEELQRLMAQDIKGAPANVGSPLRPTGVPTDLEAQNQVAHDLKTFQPAPGLQFTQGKIPNTDPVALSPSTHPGPLRAFDDRVRSLRTSYDAAQATLPNRMPVSTVSKMDPSGSIPSEPEIFMGTGGPGVQNPFPSGEQFRQMVWGPLGAAQREAFTPDDAAASTDPKRLSESMKASGGGMKRADQQVLNAVNPTIPSQPTGQAPPLVKSWTDTPLYALNGRNATQSSSGAQEAPQRPIELLRGTKRSYVSPAVDGSGFFSNPTEYATPEEARAGKTQVQMNYESRLANALQAKKLEAAGKLAEEDIKGQYAAIKGDDTVKTASPGDYVIRGGKATLVDDLAKQTPAGNLSDLAGQIEKAGDTESKVKAFAQAPRTAQRALWDSLSNETQWDMMVHFERTRKMLNEQK